LDTFGNWTDQLPKTFTNKPSAPIYSRPTPVFHSLSRQSLTPQPQLSSSPVPQFPRSQSEDNFARPFLSQPVHGSHNFSPPVVAANSHSTWRPHAQPSYQTTTSAFLNNLNTPQIPSSPPESRILFSPQSSVFHSFEPAVPSTPSVEHNVVPIFKKVSLSSVFESDANQSAPISTLPHGFAPVSSFSPAQISKLPAQSMLSSPIHLPHISALRSSSARNTGSTPAASSPSDPFTSHLVPKVNALSLTENFQLHGLGLSVIDGTVAWTASRLSQTANLIGLGLHS
jgi:hypothetical protein